MSEDITPQVGLQPLQDEQPPCRVWLNSSQTQQAFLSELEAMS